MAVQNVVIFGAGTKGREYLMEISGNAQVRIVAVLDNDIQKQGAFFFGHKISPPAEVVDLSYDKVIIAMDINSESQMERVVSVQTQLVALGVPAEKISMNNNKLRTWENGHIVLFAREYLFERCSNRRLLIYGTGAEAKALSNLLSICSIPIAYYIDEELSDILFEGKKITHWSDIVYECPDSIFIIVANEKECYGISRQKFMQLGLTEHIDFTYYRAIPTYPEPSHYDITLSLNRIRNQSGHKHVIEGFELFGDIDNPKALKIVALGGSTTESTLHFIKGWPMYLTDCFIKNGISVVTYCGGIASYTSSQELLKMIRDVVPLKPDVVLSYSGFNDIGGYPRSPMKINFEKANAVTNCPPEREKRPFITNFQVNYINEILLKFPENKRTVYYGLQNDKTVSELWLDNTRMMHAIAQEFNILFLSFLQPFLCIGGYKLTDSQKIILNRYWPTLARSDYKNDFMINRAHEMINAIKGIDYIIDLTHLFSGYTNIYIDKVHVTEQGNKIIANHIYDVLVKHL